MNDLRYALRTFARSPGLVAAAIVCLALGIGANATIFGVVDTLLFRPPPLVQNPERVVRLYFRRRLPPFGTTTSSITGYPLYTRIRESARAFDALAASTPELMGPGSLNRGSYFLQIIGRLGPGGTDAAAREATLAFRAEDMYSFGDSNAVALLGPVQHARGPEMSQNARVSLWLSAVSVIVLLVACANVANLLLARALQRQREIAVRLALGAARLRLARQLVTESVLLALAGGVAALLVSLWAGPVIRAFLLPDIPAVASAVDGRVLLFTGGVALLTGFLAGCVPALQVGRADLTPALKAGAREGRYRRSRLRSGLLVGQVALTVTLIVGAGLFVRSLRNVEGQDFGFDPAHTLLATIDLRAAGYRPVEINQLNLQMLARLQVLPGVEAAAATIG